MSVNHSLLSVTTEHVSRRTPQQGRAVDAAFDRFIAAVEINLAAGKPN